MKIKKILSLVLSIILITTLGIPSLATESRASAQIAVYGMDAISEHNDVIVDFTITGSGRMEKIGCESIYIYKLVDGRWVLTHSRAENDDGMSKTDAYFHTNILYFPCEEFEAYKVVVTVFAKNEKGRDSRSKTIYVTGK